jgi:pyruvate,water dikinase
MQSAIPSSITDAITKAYRNLSAQPIAVAVRSSATAEDLPEASFAGQQETFLNISGDEAVLEAVKKCWASLWTARAIGYRKRQNIDPQSVALAVVVQKLVFAEAAGILFTANPMNGRRDEMVINAAWGLGEAIVGGLVTPDTLTIEKAGRSILKREIADKQVMTVRTATGVEEQLVPFSQRKQAVLTDTQATELVQLAVQIEQLYGVPMDIEWALADEKFAIVQARPITALQPEGFVSEPGIKPPNRVDDASSKGQYVRASISELMPEPLTPLFGSLGRAAINRGTQRLMAKLGNMKEVGMEEMVVTINDYAYYTTRFTPKQLL